MVLVGLWPFAPFTFFLEVNDAICRALDPPSPHQGIVRIYPGPIPGPSRNMPQAPFPLARFSRELCQTHC